MVSFRNMPTHVKQWASLRDSVAQRKAQEGGTWWERSGSPVTSAGRRAEGPLLLSPLWPPGWDPPFPVLGAECGPAPGSFQDPAPPSCAGTTSTCLGRGKGAAQAAGAALRGDPSERDPCPGAPGHAFAQPRADLGRALAPGTRGWASPTRGVLTCCPRWAENAQCRRGAGGGLGGGDTGRGACARG